MVGVTQGCQNALLPATLRFSQAVNCWRKEQKQILKKMQIEKEKEVVLIMP